MRFLLVACALVFVSACGGDGDGGDGSDDTASAVAEVTTTTVTDDVCDAARAIAELDDDFQGELNAILQRIIAAPTAEDAEAAFEEIAPAVAAFDEEPLVAAYARLEDELPEATGDAARTLREFTEGFLADIRAAPDVDAVNALLESMASDPAAEAAGRAALTLDEWSRDACDVVLAD